jgi:hypothetical protein
MVSSVLNGTTHTIIGRPDPDWCSSSETHEEHQAGQEAGLNVEFHAIECRY